MNESMPLGEQNHSELSSGLKAVGRLLLTGLIRAGDCISPSGHVIESSNPQLNGLHLLMFKWFSHTSEFERQIIKLEDPSLDI